MARPRLGIGLAVQNRPGQIPSRSSWGGILLEYISTTEYVTTNDLYFKVAEKYDHLDWKVCQQYLCYLANRQLIVRIPAGRGRMQKQRRISYPQPNF